MHRDDGDLHRWSMWPLPIACILVGSGNCIGVFLCPESQKRHGKMGSAACAAMKWGRLRQLLDNVFFEGLSDIQPHAFNDDNMAQLARGRGKRRSRIAHRHHSAEHIHHGMHTPRSVSGRRGDL